MRGTEQVPHGQSEKHGAETERDDELGNVEPRPRHQRRRVDEGTEAERAEGQTRPVEGGRRALLARRHEPKGEHEDDDPDGDVDEEDPVPRGVTRQKAPQEGRHNWGDESRPGEKRDRPDQLVFSRHPQHDEAPHRHHERTARTLQNAHGHEHRQARAQGAQYGSHREEHDRESEDPARPETVAQPSARRNENGDHEQIRRDRNPDRCRRHAEIARDARGGDDQDRAVEVLHEETGGDE